MMPYPLAHPDPGVTRQVLTDDPALMTVRVSFEAGAKGKPHRHAHVQSVYVVSGRFAFSVGGREHLIGPGDSLPLPSGVTHGCRCIEAGVLIDSFSPHRDDFL